MIPNILVPYSMISMHLWTVAYMCVSHIAHMTVLFVQINFQSTVIKVYGSKCLPDDDDGQKALVGVGTKIEDYDIYNK